MSDIDNDWLCLNCDEWNLGTTLQCVVCESKMTDSCKRFNPNTGKLVELPKSNSPKMSSIQEFEGIQRGDWKCPVCTSIILLKDSVCMHCGYTIDNRVKHYGQQGDWSCMSCHNFNFHSEESCTKCGKIKAYDDPTVQANYVIDEQSVDNDFERLRRDEMIDREKDKVIMKDMEEIDTKIANIKDTSYASDENIEELDNCSDIIEDYIKNADNNNQEDRSKLRETQSQQYQFGSVVKTEKIDSEENPKEKKSSTFKFSYDVKQQEICEVLMEGSDSDEAEGQRMTFDCKLCTLTFTSLNSFEFHCKGSLHILKLRAVTGKSTYPSQFLESNSYSSKYGHKCKVCRINFESREEYLLHLTTPTHHSAIENVDKAVVANKLAEVMDFLEDRKVIDAWKRRRARERRRQKMTEKQDQRNKLKSTEKSCSGDKELAKKRSQLGESRETDQKQNYKRKKFEDIDRFQPKQNFTEKETKTDNDGNTLQRQSIIDIRDINLTRSLRGNYFKKDNERSSEPARHDFYKRKERDNRDNRRFDNNNNNRHFQEKLKSSRNMRKQFNFQYPIENPNASIERNRKFVFGMHPRYRPHVDLDAPEVANINQEPIPEFGIKTQANYRQQQGLFGRQSDNPSRNQDLAFGKSPSTDSQRGQTTLFGKKFAVTPDSTNNTRSTHFQPRQQHQQPQYNFGNLDYDDVNTPQQSRNERNDPYSSKNPDVQQNRDRSDPSKPKEFNHTHKMSGSSNRPRHEPNDRFRFEIKNESENEVNNGNDNDNNNDNNKNNNKDNGNGNDVENYSEKNDENDNENDNENNNEKCSENIIKTDHDRQDEENNDRNNEVNNNENECEYGLEPVESPRQVGRDCSIPWSEDNLRTLKALQVGIRNLLELERKGVENKLLAFEYTSREMNIESTLVASAIYELRSANKRLFLELERINLQDDSMKSKACYIMKELEKITFSN
ncbi:DgyrCDS6153 [Dimorphilus gyrociliatus]|uniref:DgyrCDS6153 n=1 Tax=Dimorphilus gyrociliatus TaxID=2664684 RepID=A0A7I8VQ12_9ANNE|nr:DgyrCDS6153 [Dimorphilus gyrociliatus]